MKAAIIVDSTAGLTEETIKFSNVYQVYLSTIFEDGTVYADSPDETLTKDVYERMDTEKNLPKTAQSDTKHINDVFEQLIQEGYDTVFGILLSEKISGTFHSVQATS
ncbi:DegV family protein [Aerococcaceae bacterium INB8]|uniref:DegV family protein n=1 Tax=Ruoffia halotolerans TaxID=2748684 RepID=A0A839A751_9LACT|nr:DegV family protein [Ruoffia halotolerans]